jgi:hypothetical protein
MSGLTDLLMSAVLLLTLALLTQTLGKVPVFDTALDMAGNALGVNLTGDQEGDQEGDQDGAEPSAPTPVPGPGEGEQLFPGSEPPILQPTTPRLQPGSLPGGPPIYDPPLRGRDKSAQAATKLPSGEAAQLDYLLH